MKKWMICVMAALVLAVSVLPSSAVFKAVNNNREPLEEFFLNDCDDPEGWAATGDTEVTQDEKEATEGWSSIRFERDFDAYTNEGWTIAANFPKEDLSKADYVAFDFYISHPELIESSYQITVAVGSSGRYGEWIAAMFEANCKEGWNRVILPFAEMQSRSADMSRIDSFHIQFNYINLPEKIEDLTVRIDNIVACGYGTRAITLMDCESTEGWRHVDEVDTTNQTQGECALTFFTTPVSVGGDGNMVRECVFPVPINGSGADYLEFDLYVSDAHALRPENCLGYGAPHEFIVEITSSGRCDSEEYSWKIQSDFGDLKDGWNHIRLPIATAGTSGGAPDMSRLNYFRFFFLSMQTCKNDLMVVKLDNVYLSVIQDGEEDDPSAENPGTDTPGTDTPGTDTPGTDTPGTDTPGTDTPGTDTPGTDTPGTDTPGTDTPGTDTPGTENPGQTDSVEEPLTERQKLTYTRATGVLIAMGVVIVGVNIVAVILRKRALAV